jgi:putative oxidoreductase
MKAHDLIFGRPFPRLHSVNIGLLVLRLFTGLALALAHGIGKLPPSEGFMSRVGTFGFPLPEALAWASGFAETGGGLLLAAGLLTRPAALLVMINMSVAVVFGHAGDPFTGYEKALLFGVCALLYLIAGPGRFSLDALIRRRRARAFR